MLGPLAQMQLYATSFFNAAHVEEVLWEIVGTERLNPNNDEQMKKHVDELVRRLTLEDDNYANLVEEEDLDKENKDPSMEDALREPEWEQVNDAESDNNEP
jgi:hypothetical protein